MRCADAHLRMADPGTGRHDRRMRQGRSTMCMVHPPRPLLGLHECVDRRVCRPTSLGQNPSPCRLGSRLQGWVAGLVPSDYRWKHLFNTAQVMSSCLQRASSFSCLSVQIRADPLDAASRCGRMLASLLASGTGRSRGARSGAARAEVSAPAPATRALRRRRFA